MAEVIWRQSTQDDFGGVDVAVGEQVVRFRTAPGPSHGTSYACTRCGAYITDWLYRTDKETNEKVRLPLANAIRHAEWHCEHDGTR